MADEQIPAPPPATSGDQPAGAPRPARARSRRRLIPWALLAMVAIVGGAAALLALHNAPRTTPEASTKALKAEAASKNVTLADLPAGWGIGSAQSSPLSGLLGTAPQSKPTAQETRLYDEIIAEYQRCMGLTKKTDREFGDAGVQPLVQVPSRPYGVETNDGLVEVGTVTQIYSSSGDVDDDLRQLTSHPFNTCFPETMARLVWVGTDPSDAKGSPSTVHQTLSPPLGVKALGGTSAFAVSSSGGEVPIEIGTTFLGSGRYEQVIYTFGSPGSFPDAVRSSLVGTLGSRLAGFSAGTSS